MRYTYTEYVSKNRSGGLKQLRENNKVVHQYESTDVDRCHVLILDKYFQKMPQDARTGQVFYLKPKNKKPANVTDPWYLNVPLGKNTLASMMKRIAEKGNLEKKLSNHSLRAYGVSKMFKENVPENLIMSRSGHRSIEGVRGYARTTSEQDYQVCSALQTKCSEVSLKKPSPQEIQPEIAHNKPTPQTFQGCSFVNCTIVTGAPSTVPLPPPPPLTEDFSNVTIEELFDFS